VTIDGRQSFDAGRDWTGRLAFSQAVRAGGFVFASGQPGTDETGRPAGDAEAQARLAFANLDAVLRDAGSALAHVVRFTTLLRDMGDLDTVVRVRRELLQPPYPADTVFQAAALARPEFLLEIDAIAVVPHDRPSTA
jgi:enamine deaminase RidA (YjgF/YER057c/UK114 family)